MTDDGGVSEPFTYGTSINEKAPSASAPTGRQRKALLILSAVLALVAIGTAAGLTVIHRHGEYSPTTSPTQPATPTSGRARASSTAPTAAAETPDLTKATLWNLDCSNPPGADGGYAPGKVVIDKQVAVTPPGDIGQTLVAAASCDGASTDEVGWFAMDRPHQTVGDHGTIVYPPSDGSTIRVSGLRADNNSEVTATGTITSRTGKTRRFQNTYSEGAHGWGINNVSSPTPTSTASPTTGGVGYGSIKIGMSADQLKASGGVTGAPWTQLSSPSPQGGCWALSMADADGHVLFNPDDGKVDAIEFGPRMATSRGIHIGSTVAALKQAYPDLDTSYSESDSWVALVDNATRYYISADSSAVIGLILGADDQGCFG